MELDPAHRDADEAGRPDLGQQGEQCFGRRVAGEDVGAAPVDGPQHLEIAAEGVVERQEAQEDLVRADGGQGGGPGEALGDKVVDGEGDALGTARRARREHDRGHLVETEAAAPVQAGVDVAGAELLAELGQEDHPGVVPERRIGDQDEEGPGRPAAGFFQQGEPLAVVGQGHVDGQGVENGDDVLQAEVGIERRIEDVVEQAGQVGEGALGMVLGIDGQPGFLAVAVGQGEQGGGGLADVAVGGLVGPDPGRGGGHVLEERTVRGLSEPVLEHIAEAVARPADQGERSFGPAVEEVRGGQVAQEGRLGGPAKQGPGLRFGQPRPGGQGFLHLLERLPRREEGVKPTFSRKM